MLKKRLPILQKVFNLLKISIFIAKLRKPIIPKLTLLKKSRKLKKFKLLKHYNYGFLEEYQFSPSSTVSTPLIHYRSFQKRRRGDMHSFFFLCSCLRSLAAEGEEGDIYRLEALSPAIGDVEFGEAVDSSDGEDSVDKRAERFIERFYEEMRMQRRESI